MELPARQVLDTKLTAASIFLFLQILVPTVLSQVVTSNVTNDNVCSGDVIIFTCDTTGSGGIAWSSDEYIGVGNELEFNVLDIVGDTSTSQVNPDVVATFLRKDGVDVGNPLLRSQLTLTVSSAFRTHPVTCVYVSNTSRVHTVQHQTLAVPEMPSDMISNQTMDTMDNCVVHLSWLPPANMDSNDLSHYMIHIDGENVINKTHTVTNNSSLLQFAYPLCTCGDLTVSIQAVSRCGRTGSKTVTVVPLPLSLPTCDAKTTQPICTAQNEEIISLRKEVKSCKSDLIGTTIFLCLVLVGVTIALAVLAVLYVKAKKYIKELEDKIKKLKNNVNEDEVKVKEDEEKIKKLENEVKEDKEKIKELENEVKEDKEKIKKLENEVKEDEKKIKKLGGEINGPIEREIDIEDSRIQYKTGTEEIIKVMDVETEAEM